MDGKFRKRANTVWCPKPQPAIICSKEDELEFIRWKEGDILVRKKKVTGWMNMDNCSNCPHLEEYHIEELGVFCLYPKTLEV